MTYNTRLKKNRWSPIYIAIVKLGDEHQDVYVPAVEVHEVHEDLKEMIAPLETKCDKWTVILKKIVFQIIWTNRQMTMSQGAGRKKEVVPQSMKNLLEIIMFKEDDGKRNKKYQTCSGSMKTQVAVNNH